MLDALEAPIADSRHAAGAAATLSLTWTDSAGEPAAPSGTVKVHVTLADGSDLLAAGTAATVAANVVSVPLTAAQTASLNFLTAVWTDGGGAGASRTSTHELVGRFYFSAADARTWDADLAQSDKFPLERMHEVRDQVERECEFITGQAWVPRYRRVAVSGNDDDSITLPDAVIRTVRSVRVYSSATAYTSFSAAELAELSALEDGRLIRPAGKAWVMRDELNHVIEYEHGRNSPNQDLLEAVLIRFRNRLPRARSGYSERAGNITLDGVGSFTIDAHDPSQFRTGLPDVDAVYARFSRRRNRIVSGNIDYNPTRQSLFHGGVR